MEASPIEVQKALKGIDYPANKKDLIKQAKNNDASEKVMNVLENLPDKKYQNAVDVSREFKGEGEKRGGSRSGGQEGHRRGSRGGNKGSSEEEGGRESHKGSRGHSKEE
ncbi:MAG TPA: DUF2795 domain-containing protein [Methanosarcina sp.]|nr:DUF2795 domain-containing protein [Methanosarcina sp.]